MVFLRVRQWRPLRSCLGGVGELGRTNLEEVTATRGLRQDINDLRGEVGELRERMAHLEGLLEGLRESIIGRAAAG